MPGIRYPKNSALRSKQMLPNVFKSMLEGRASDSMPPIHVDVSHFRFKHRPKKTI